MKPLCIKIIYNDAHYRNHENDYFCHYSMENRGENVPNAT